MMQSEMGTMKNNQNLLLSFIMSCLNQEQLKSFVSIFGGFGGHGSQFGNFGGQVGQFANVGSQPGFGGHRGSGGPFGFGGQPGSFGQSSLGCESGSGGQSGGQSSIQSSSGGQFGFGGHAGSGGQFGFGKQVEFCGLGGLGGNRLGFTQLNNSVNSVDHEFLNMPFTQLLTTGVEQQQSEGHQLLEPQSQEAACVSRGYKAQQMLVPLQSPEAEMYHVSWPQTEHINQPDHSHQNNHDNFNSELTFPEGWSDCQLAIEDGNKGQVIVANGKVYVQKAEEVIMNHGILLPRGHRRVSIKEDLVPNAPLPSPNDELLYVCQAKGSYIAWPMHLILPIKDDVHLEKDVTTLSPRSASSQTSTTHKHLFIAQDSEKLTTSCLQSLKAHALRMKERSESIFFSFQKSVFLTEHVVNVTLDYEDLLNWCFQKDIGAAHLNIFMKYLKEQCQEEGISGMFAFCDSNAIYPMTPKIEEENPSNYLARVFGCNDGKNRNQLFFAPYNENRTWMLAVISPWNGIVYWLDPAGAENIPEFAKSFIDEGIKQFSVLYRKDIKKIKKNAKIMWKQPKCPTHQEKKDYGYFLCRYMLEILEKRVI